MKKGIHENVSLKEQITFLVFAFSLRQVLPFMTVRNVNFKKAVTDQQRRFLYSWEYIRTILNRFF